MDDCDKKELLSFYRKDQVKLDSSSSRDKLILAQISQNDGSRSFLDNATDLTLKLSVFYASLCVIDLFGVFPIVTLPKSIISCGFYGIPLILFVITLQIYTAVVLGRCWTIAERLDPSITEKNRYPYAALADFTYGKYMSNFVTILLDLTVFGGGIPNLLVAAQNLQLIGSRISGGSFEFSFCYWLLIIGVFLSPMMWLGSPKHMKPIASTSVVVCSLTAILTWYSILKDTNEVFEPFAGIELNFPPWIDLLKAYGIIAFQFDLHPMLLTIQVDMQKRRNIGNAVCYGIMTTCILSGITTVLSAWRYGTSITSNVLVILPRSISLYLTILLVTIQLCLTMAVGSSALFQHIEELLGASRHFTLKRCIIRTFLVWLQVIIGAILPHFDIVMGIIGGTLTGPLIFILPPLFYQKIMKMEKKFDDEMSPILIKDPRDNELQLRYGSIEKEVQFTSDSSCFNIGPMLWKFMRKIYSYCILSSAVIMFGLAATFSSTYYNLFDLNKLPTDWSPCIRNLTFLVDLFDFDE